MAQQPRNSVIPGFGLSLGYTLSYLTLLVLIPLGALILKSSLLSWAEFRGIVTDDLVVAAVRLSVQASLAAALINSVFGLIVAWVLVRYPFPGRRLFDAMVDFPFALPTAVAGLAFATLYTRVGWIDAVQIGSWITAVVNRALSLFGDWRLDPAVLSGLDQFRIIIMLVFVGLPFVVRTVQPVLQDWDPEVEQAAESLGAGKFTIFRRLIFAEILPAWLSGLALAFARAVGEYGSVIFVAGNRPGVSEIAPVQIVSKLYGSDTNGPERATAVGVVLLLISLVILLFINGLDWWSRRHERSS